MKDTSLGNLSPLRLAMIEPLLPADRRMPAGAFGHDFRAVLAAAANGNATQGGAAPGGAPTGHVSTANAAQWQAPSSDSHTVRPGDTLTAVARRALVARGADTSQASVLRAAQEIARSNGIADADRIFVGQRIELSALGAPPPRDGARPASAGNTAAAAGVPAVAPAAASITARPAASTAAARPASSHTLLERTLDRAVSKGYIPATERDAVRARVVELGERHGFQPDHFAMMTLMESDGMDPRATNGRCHGIIQFCEGPDRGAASAGFEGRARDIRELSVLDQLDLVERYFDDVGLKGQPVSLMDLYLSVLTPAARAERRPNAELGIAGPQAAMLHVGGDRNRPITRNSLAQGLHRNAVMRLGIDDADARNAKMLPPTAAQAIAARGNGAVAMQSPMASALSSAVSSPMAHDLLARRP